jgi:1,2-diacylglycerol-3-alpha-glucose alpha-1,2-galactosyltransferase
MKVLIVQGSGEESGGGVETFVRTLSRSIRMKDVSFTILFPVNDFTFKKTDHSIDRVKYLPVYIPLSDHIGLLKALRLFLFNIKILLSRAIYSEQFDIVHINGLAGCFLPLRFRHNSLFTAHGSSINSFLDQKQTFTVKELFFQFINSIFSYSLEFIAVKFSKLSVSVSSSVAREFSRVTKKKVEVIPNGIELEDKAKADKASIEKKYNLNEKSFICLWVGRNPKRKGLDVAIRSVSDIKGAYLLIVGIDKNIFIEKNENVIFCGIVDRDELLKLYASSDLLIFPSVYEAMSYTVIEALSIGLPVLAYRKRFMTDILGQEYPLLCDNELEFKKEVENMMTWKKEDINGLKEKCQKIAEGFNADKMAAEYLKIYEAMANE